MKNLELAVSIDGKLKVAWLSVRELLILWQVMLCQVSQMQDVLHRRDGDHCWC
jgi:hypothetical protein